jgi:hypothetical protein
MGRALCPQSAVSRPINVLLPFAALWDTAPYLGQMSNITLNPVSFRSRPDSENAEELVMRLVVAH